jgi:hypothetical protein
MATHVVWDHEWQIRALPPRPAVKECDCGETGRHSRLEVKFECPIGNDRSRTRQIR